MPEYNNTFRRLEKIKATIEQLHAENISYREKLRKRDETLVAKVRRLEDRIKTLEGYAAARERVLQSVYDDLEKLREGKTSS